MDDDAHPPTDTVVPLKDQIALLESEVARLAAAGQFPGIGPLHHRLHILRTSLRSEQTRSQWQGRADRSRAIASAKAGPHRA